MKSERERHERLGEVLHEAIIYGELIECDLVVGDGWAEYMYRPISPYDIEKSQAFYASAKRADPLERVTVAIQRLVAAAIEGQRESETQDD